MVLVEEVGDTLFLRGGGGGGKQQIIGTRFPGSARSSFW
jgi:hypothetical protein